MPKRRTERSTIGADATRRAARTLFQIGTVTALIQLWNLFSARPLAADQVAAVTTVGTILISFLQNLLEENGAVPEMLKRPAAPVPPTDDPPPADDETTREILALAAANGHHKNEIERLEGMMLDLRTDLRNAYPDAEPRISTRQVQPDGTPFRG